MRTAPSYFITKRIYSFVHPQMNNDKGEFFSPLHSHLTQSATSLPKMFFNNTTLEALKQKSAWTMSFVSSSLDELAKLQLKWQSPELGYAYRTVYFCSNKHVREFLQEKWNDMTCFAQSHEIGLIIKKRSYINFPHKKMEWRTWLKIHRIVLTWKAVWQNFAAEWWKHLRTTQKIEMQNS